MGRGQAGGGWGVGEERVKASPHAPTRKTEEAMVGEEGYYYNNRYIPTQTTIGPIRRRGITLWFVNVPSR